MHFTPMYGLNMAEYGYNDVDFFEGLTWRILPTRGSE